MKATKMSQDEFAKFIAGQVLTIGNYNFDVLYDIKMIVTEFNENRGKHETPIYSNFHLMVRSTGSDLVRENDENYSIYDARTSIIYSLTFCWNCDYFHNIPFCSVEKLR